MFLKKQIFQLSVLKSLLTTEDSCVTLIPTTRLLSLPPCFLNNIKKGIFFILNKALKKYDQNLDGILIGYQNVKILMDERTGLIPMGVADIRVNVSIEFYVFQPKIGGYLQGIVNKKSNSHIGCLVHKYFNASILKPDEVEYDDWECKDIEVDDHIKFKVVDLDFTCYVPRIEGTIEENSSTENSRMKESNSNLVEKIIPNEYEFEKGLLKSEEFWTQKLNKANWVPDMDFQESDKNSRKRTFSSMTLSSMAAASESEFEKDEFSPKKKKQKKNKEHKIDKKVEDEKDKTFLEHNEQCTIKNEKKTKKINILQDKEKSIISDDVISGLLDNKNKNIKDDENIHLSKKICNRSMPLIEASKLDNLLGSKKKEKANVSLIVEKRKLELHDFDNIQTISNKKSRKRKRDTVLDSVKTPKILESTPLTTKNKKSTHNIEKQSESDSGVGLEPKESVCSPILFQTPKKKKKSNETPKACDESISTEKKSSDSNHREMDAILLQNSLVEEAKKIFRLRDSGTNILNTGSDSKCKNEVDLNNQNGSKKTNKIVKNDSKLIKKDSTKKNSSKHENSMSSMDKKSLNSQMKQNIHKSDSEEDEIFEALTQKTTSSNLDLLGKNSKSTKSNSKKIIEDSKNNDNHASNPENDHKELLERLKRENVESLLSKNKNSKLNSKKKKKKEKNDKKKKKEKNATDFNINSICAKLLQDALNNINGADVEISDKSDNEITEKSKIEIKPFTSNNISNKVEKTPNKKKKEKKEKGVKKSRNSGKVDSDVEEVKNQKETSKKKTKDTEGNLFDSSGTESKKNKEKNKKEKIKKTEKKEKSKRKEKKSKKSDVFTNRNGVPEIKKNLNLTSSLSSSESTLEVL